MRHFEFPPDILAEIERDRFCHVDPQVQRRMEILWLKAHAEPHEKIAKLAGVSRATVQRTLDLYESGSLAAVRGRRTARSGPHPQRRLPLPRPGLRQTRLKLRILKNPPGGRHALPGSSSAAQAPPPPFATLSPSCRGETRGHGLGAAAHRSVSRSARTLRPPYAAVALRILSPTTADAVSKRSQASSSENSKSINFLLLEGPDAWVCPSDAACIAARGVRPFPWSRNRCQAADCAPGCS